MLHGPGSIHTARQRESQRLSLQGLHLQTALLSSARSVLLLIKIHSSETGTTSIKRRMSRLLTHNEKLSLPIWIEKKRESFQQLPQSLILYRVATIHSDRHPTKYEVGRSQRYLLVSRNKGNADVGPFLPLPFPCLSLTASCWVDHTPAGRSLLSGPGGRVSQRPASGRAWQVWLLTRTRMI